MFSIKKVILKIIFTVPKFIDKQNMNPKIPYCLGFDIGVASIGWAARTLAMPYKILDAGVRIVPLTVDETTNFPKGKAITTTKERTEKRTARRNLHRYRLRRYKLCTKLDELGMKPDARLFALSATELYGLRDKALREKLSLQEIGRILLHLNQKRGYRSSRKAQNEDDKQDKNQDETEGKTTKKGGKNTDKSKEQPKEKGYLDKIADREQVLKEKGLTIGQFFYQKFSENSLYITKNEIYNRDTYKAEFEAIWKCQAAYHKDVLTEGLRKELCDRIIYYQRRLKSQKHLVSWCSYEPTQEIADKKGKKITIGYKTAPRSSPLFQQFVIWQRINDLRILTKGNKKGEALLLAHKQFLFEKLNTYPKSKITAKECLALLATVDSGFADKKQGFELNFKEVECNRTYTELHQLLAANPAYSKWLDFELKIIECKDKNGNLQVNEETGEVKIEVSPAFEQEPLYKLWHLLYATEEDKHLKERLEAKFGFDKETIEKLCKIDFTKGGFGNLSAKAIRKLLPQMQQGQDVRSACVAVGYKHSDSETVAEREARVLKDKLEILPKNALKNPVVEKVLNQIIHLVNEIVQLHGRPAEIRIELARDLRMNAKKRQEMTKNIGSRAKERLKNETELRELINSGEIKRKEGRDKISLSDLLKYELWLQQDKVSPYTGNTIPIGLLFDTQFYDKEHIFPQSRFYDDSPTNLVIVERNENQTKNQLTAADYMKSKGEAAYQAFVERVNNCKGFSRTKKARLLAESKDIPNDFINRQLAETRYIGKKLKEILRDICPNITSTTGGVTAWLREQWELDAVFEKAENGKVAFDKHGFAIKQKDSLLKELRFEKYAHLKKREDEIQALLDKDRLTEKEKETLRAEQKKNRDDHRHHLLDALVIAFTTQGHIQKLNNLNAAYENPTEANEGKYRLYVEPPIPNFREVVKNVLQNTLVSFRGSSKIGTWKLNRETGKRELTPRGYLHKETLYGSVQRYRKVKLDKKLFANLEPIIDNELKAKLQKLLKQYGNEVAALEKYLKKNPILQNGKPVVETTIFVREITAKYGLNSLVAKDTQYIVDKGVRKAVEKRLQEHAEIEAKIKVLQGKKPKSMEDEAAIKELQAQKLLPLYMKNGMEIKTVKLFTNNDNSVTALYDKPNTPYVQQRNNHHVAIYQDKAGKIQECVVTFWEAVSRKRLGLPAIIKDAKAAWQQIENEQITDRFIVGKEANMPQKDWTFVQSIVGGEMFILDLPVEDLQKAVEENNYTLLSKHLYRIQKFSEGEYVFRHHLEANLENAEATKTLTKSSYAKAIKVVVNRLGKIVKIGE